MELEDLRLSAWYPISQSHYKLTAEQVHTGFKSGSRLINCVSSLLLKAFKIGWPGSCNNIILLKELLFSTRHSRRKALGTAKMRWWTWGRTHPKSHPWLTIENHWLLVLAMQLWCCIIRKYLQLYQIIFWSTGTPQSDVIEKDLVRIYSPHRQVGPVTSLLPHPQFLWRHGGQIHIVLVWSKLSTRSSSSSPPTSTAVASIRRHYREVDRSGFPVPRLSCLLRAFLEEICGHQKKNSMVLWLIWLLHEQQKFLCSLSPHWIFRYSYHI
jgi:hypothetical protein